MNEINTIQTEIAENFQLFEEWDDKYEYLLEFITDVKPLKEAEKTEYNLVKGCQSRIWILSEFRDGKVWYKIDGDALIPKGIAAVLQKILTGRDAESIVKSDINFQKETGLVKYLSPARVKGIESMILKFKSLAAQHLINN